MPGEARIGYAAMCPAGGQAQACPAKDDPERARDAARQFEALLIAQILRSARGSEGGWLGSGGDSAGECAAGYAEEQFALQLAQRGGLGLADLIAAGLARK